MLLILAATRELAYLEGEWMAWPPGEIARKWLTQFAAGISSALLAVSAVAAANRSKRKLALGTGVACATILFYYVL